MLLRLVLFVILVPHVFPFKSLVISIIDESGSMDTITDHVIKGYNSFIKEQQAVANDQANYTLIKFASKVEVLQNNVRISDALLFNRNLYEPAGLTSLYAAILKGIELAAALISRFDRIIFLIITDGEENPPSWNQVPLEDVAHVIKDRSVQLIWTFLYVGEQPEAVAMQLNIPPGNAIPFNVQDPESSFANASLAVMYLRKSNELSISDAFVASHNGMSSLTGSLVFLTVVTFVFIVLQ